MALDLFHEPAPSGTRPPLNEWTHTPKLTESADIYNYAARRVLGVGPDWQWFQLKAVKPDCVMVTGDVPIGRKKNGAPKWGPEKDAQTCVLTPAAIEQATADWEAEHGACARCGGDGMAWAGSSATQGRKFSKCDRCHGTGRAAA